MVILGLLEVIIKVKSLSPFSPYHFLLIIVYQMRLYSNTVVVNMVRVYNFTICTTVVNTLGIYINLTIRCQYVECLLPFHLYHSC